MKGHSPEAMEKVFIAVDNLKRQVGKFRNKVKNDPMPREKVEGLYEKFRTFLENPNVWGEGMSQAQKEINIAWKKYLDVAPAVEATFMRTGKKSTTTATNKWDKVAELDTKRIQSVLSDPKNPAHAKDIANLNTWLDATEEITKNLEKYYKTPVSLEPEVKNIIALRKEVLAQLDNAGADFTRTDKVGIPAHKKALENVTVARQRGLGESENMQAIGEQQARREALTGEPQNQLTREHEYADKVDKTTSNLYDEDALFGPMRATERGIKRGVPGGAAYGGSTDIVQAMWGDRPVATIESNDDQASIKAFDKIEKNPNITKEKKDEFSLKQSVADRKSKGGHTTIV
jgi:hypothetical protein